MFHFILRKHSSWYESEIILNKIISHKWETTLSFDPKFINGWSPSPSYALVLSKRASVPKDLGAVHLSIRRCAVVWLLGRPRQGHKLGCSTPVSSGCLQAACADQHFSPTTLWQHQFSAPVHFNVSVISMFRIQATDTICMYFEDLQSMC